MKSRIVYLVLLTIHLHADCEYNGAGATVFKGFVTTDHIKKQISTLLFFTLK